MKWLAPGGWLIMAFSLATSARAEDRSKSTGDPQHADAGAARRPLSAEDLELLKDLSLLERLELLRNLDLFEPDDAGRPKEEPKG